MDVILALLAALVFCYAGLYVLALILGGLFCLVNIFKENWFNSKNVGEKNEVVNSITRGKGIDVIC